MTMQLDKIEDVLSENLGEGLLGTMMNYLQ